MIKKSSKSNNKERRQAVRAKRILSIQYRLRKSRYRGGDTQWHLSTTHDMSAVGIAFLSDVSYRVGDILELHTVMSGVIDVMKGFGKVIRIESKARGEVFLIAVEFTPSLKSKKRKTITRSKR